MLEYNDLILKPIVTEKSTELRKSLNQYSFEIHPLANKSEVVKALQKMFEVKILKSRVINIKGKLKRYRNKVGYTKNRKKIIVTLAKDSKIDFFEGF